MKFAPRFLRGPGIVASAFVAIVVFTQIEGTAVEPKAEAEKALSERKHEEKNKGKMLRHVVLFKFKPATTSEQLKQVTDAFAALPDKIDVIRDFEWGTDVSVENLSKGFTHCFFVTFADAAGRDAYLPHPAHKEFVDLVKPLLDDVTVVDYWVK